MARWCDMSDVDGDGPGTCFDRYIIHSTSLFGLDVLNLPPCLPFHLPLASHGILFKGGGFLYFLGADRRSNVSRDINGGGCSLSRKLNNFGELRLLKEFLESIDPLRDEVPFHETPAVPFFQFCS